MYQTRDIGEDSFSLSVLLNEMFLLRKDRKEPGRWSPSYIAASEPSDGWLGSASSSASRVLVSADPCSGRNGEGSLGCEILF